MLVVTILLVTSGCATAYHPADGATDPGYTDSTIAENRITVSFAGYGASLAHRLAVVRAAEIAHMRGYRAMVMVTDTPSVIRRGPRGRFLLNRCRHEMVFVTGSAPLEGDTIDVESILTAHFDR